MWEFDVVEIASALQVAQLMKTDCSMWMRHSAEIRAREIQASSVEGQMLYISMRQVRISDKNIV